MTDIHHPSDLGAEAPQAIPRPPGPFPIPVPIPAPVPVPPTIVQPTVTQLPTPTLGGAVGCDFLAAQNALLFVEYSGNLSRLNLYPSATVLASGTNVLDGTWTFDLDTGTEGGASTEADIWWDQETATARQMAVMNNAQIFNLGAVDFDTLGAAGLQSLPYGTAPIPGNDPGTNLLVAGDVFAVRTTAGNLAKVKVTAYGYNMTIDWVTYQLASGYQVLGTGYLEPEDVKASADGVHAYVTERAGNLLRVDLSSAARSAATVVASGLNSPQQLFLDEGAGVAYTVEYAPSGTLWRIDLATGTPTAVVTGLNNAVGLTVSADGQYAYISEQTTGPDAGRVSRYQLSTGTRTGLVTGLTAPFFLTWTDSTQTALYCPQRDPLNNLLTVPTTGGDQVAATGLAFRPSSAAVVSPGVLLVCTDSEIEKVVLAADAQQSDGPLVQGVGFVPVSSIVGGLANTSGDPSYFFQVDNVPFGGSLPLMVNFLRAALDGAAYYQVLVDGNVRQDQFPTQIWNGTEYVPTVFGPVSLGGNPGYYPVPSVAELMLYVQPLPGCYLDSTSLTSGSTHQITVNFVDGSGSLIETADPLTIFVDNNPCTLTVTAPAIGTSTTTPCGYLAYNPASAATDDVFIGFAAGQPESYATWSLQVAKASTTIVSESGPVPNGGGGYSQTVLTLLGGCTVAAYAVSIYVAASATTGWARCSQYDRSALEAFALAPAGA